MTTNTGKTVLALMAGAAIGAGVGILFAPDKGSRTREKIKDGFEDAKDELKHKLKSATNDLKSRFSNAKYNLEDTYEDLISNMSNKTEDVISFLENKLSDLKSQNTKLQKYQTNGS